MVSKEDLKQVMQEVLHERRSIDDDEHRAQHDWIALRIKQDQLRTERWEKFQSSFIGGLALAVLAGLGWVGKLIWHSRDVA